MNVNGGTFLKKIVFACLKKDFLNSLSYKLPSFMRLFNSFLVVIVFYFVYHSFVKKPSIVHLEGYQITYFAFVLTGMILARYLLATLSIFSQQMEEERRMGTLEALLMTPTRFITIIISMYVWSFVIVFVYTIPVLLFGVYVLNIKFTGAMIIAILVIFALSIIIFGAIAIMLSAFIIVFKKGRSVTILVNSVFRILGNIYLPVVIFPKCIKVFSCFLPISYSMKAFRQILFKGDGLMGVASEIIILLIFSVILWPLSIFIFKCCLRKAKKIAGLSHY